MYSTKEVRSGSEIKAENRKALREFHKQTLAEMNAPETSLDGKVAFMYNSRRVVTAFGNQMNREPHGYFFEITDNQNNPIDQKRTLYWIRPNANYSEEFEEQTEKNASLGYVTSETKMYYLPLDEAIPVTKGTKAAAAIMSEKNFDLDKIDTTVPEEDMDLSRMTILDQLAITQLEPVSNKKFLNDKIKAIKQARKN